MLSRIGVGTSRRRRRGMFARYHSIENNDGRATIGSVVGTYGDVALRTVLDGEEVVLSVLQFSFSSGRRFVGEESGRL